MSGVARRRPDGWSPWGYFAAWTAFNASAAGLIWWFGAAGLFQTVLTACLALNWLTGIWRLGIFDKGHVMEWVATLAACILSAWVGILLVRVVFGISREAAVALSVAAAAYIPLGYWIGSLFYSHYHRSEK